jgi:hypothetical protein
MAGKKKKGKGKKKKKEKNTGPQKLVVPNFLPIHRIKLPIAIKVHHLDDTFLIYSDEYNFPDEILNEINKITGRDIKTMRLYFNTKRLVDLSVCNHDQQIKHNIDLFIIFQNENVWENIKEIINYNIYDVDLESILEKEEEERKAEEKRKEEEEKKKKEAEELSALKQGGRFRKI